MRSKLPRIDVRASATCHTRGRLIVGGVVYPCVLGSAGVVTAKREGDGGTPRGLLPLREVIWRNDRSRHPVTALPSRPIRRDDAWCDDVADRRYNRPIRRLDDAAQERLWREDRLYDVVVPLGWNDGPVRKGRGSAIFWHVCHAGRSPTAGCVAVTPEVFRKVLPRLSRRAAIRVW